MENEKDNYVHTGLFNARFDDQLYLSKHSV